MACILLNLLLHDLNWAGGRAGCKIRSRSVARHFFPGLTMADCGPWVHARFAESGLPHNAFPLTLHADDTCGITA